MSAVDEAQQAAPPPSASRRRTPAALAAAPLPVLAAARRSVRRSRRRGIAIGLALAVAAAILLTLLLPRHETPREIPPPPPTATGVLHELGTIEALEEASVLTHFTGDIVWKIEEGTFVERGTPIVKFETRDVEDDIESRLKDLAGKQDNVRRAQADIDLAVKKYAFQIRQQEIALETATLDRDHTYNYPREDEKLDVELSLRSAELELKRVETDEKGLEELAARGFVSEATLKKKNLELAQKKINFNKAKLLRDLALQGLSKDDKRLADMAVADAKKRLQIANFNREQDLAVMQANLELAQIDLHNFERDLARRRRDLELATVRAPSRGRVAFVDVWKGSSDVSPIQVGEQRPSGSDLCKICDTSRLRLNVFVNESDIGRVHLKQRAQVKLAAFPGRGFSAVVSEIGAVAQDKNVAISPLASRNAGEAFVRVVAVKLDFADLSEVDRKEIRIGFSADVFIDLSSPQPSGTEAGR